MTEFPSASLAWGELAATFRTPSIALLDDQNRHWQEGRRVPVEHYLEHVPWLKSDSEALLDLVYNEIRLREEKGESPDFEEYRRRFAQLEESLGIQWQVHRAISMEEVLDELCEPADSPSAKTLPTIDGYEVLAELGRGAMGVVYKARHLRLNRLVALKMILSGAHAGPRELARFETEARAAARLHHPHIVQIHEIGEQEGRPYVCLELVPGENLAQKLNGRPLSPRKAAELAELLARAVHHAHEQRIVHRDLKPANVLLAPSAPRRGMVLGSSPEDGYVEPKITDFGLAKLLDSGTESSAGLPTFATAAPVGTPPYMAPEQAERFRINPYGMGSGGDHATDIYSLGAILYELLTGRPPFLGATVYETLQQVVHLEPVLLRRLQPSVPRDLETICLACLRKKPTRRYATALDLAEDLARFLDGKPIRQRPQAVWEPALKWTRRRPAAAAWALAGIAVCITLMGLGAYYLEHRHEWARQGALRRFKQFVERRNDAIFQGTLLGTLRVAPEAQADARRGATLAAESALALAGVTDNQTPPVHDIYLTEAEKSELDASCRDLLVVLARAAAEPQPRMTLTERQEKALEGLCILDRAARFGPPTRALHLQRAHLLELRENRFEAEAERRRAATLQPVTADDFYFTGVDYYRQGAARDAIHSFQQALHLQPDHFEAQCFLAIGALNASRLGEAQTGLTACIGLRPGFAWSYLLRGVAEVQADAFAEAETDFAAALRLDDNRQVRYAVHSNRGRSWLRQGKLAESISELRAAIAIDPNECPAHLLLARAYERQGRFAEADGEIEAALRLCPALPVVHRARAEFLEERQDFNEAVTAYKKAIVLETEHNNSPALAADYLQCGSIRYKQGRFQEALAAYESALRVAPERALAHHLRGATLLALSRLHEAERAYGQCLKSDAGFGPALRGRGTARMRLGDYAGAVEDYTAAVAIERDASILVHRGWAYFFADAWRVAEHDFEEAIKLDKQAGDAYVGRALARVMLGAYKKAVADADEALRAHKPRTPEMMHNVACVFALAAARVQLDVAEPTRQSLETRYRQRALAALHETLLLLPDDRREEFWKTRMRPDTAVDSIRRSPEFASFEISLDKEFVRKRDQARKETRPPEK
jgi:serine/threonine protein kinase/Tfp pilus assembly protein PilF